MHRPFRGIRTAALLGLALMAACKDGTGPGGAPGVTVIASPAQSDTVDAQPGQLLTLEIRDGQGALIRSGPVRVTSPTLQAPPLCTQGCSPRAGLTLTDQSTGGGVTRTGEDGRVSLRLRFGGTAGTARLVVSAAEGTVVDTLEFTVLPGNATRVFMLPADTAVYFNTTSVLHPSGADRNGNPTSDAVALSSTSLSLSGATITGAPYGVHTVVAALGSMRAEGKVTVVPRGTLALATEFGSGRIRIFDLDGSNARSFAVGEGVGSWGLDWTPDGSALVVAVGTSSPTRSLRRLAMDGTVTPFPAEGVIDVLRPRFSADGEWLYFVGRTTAAEAPQIIRARSDGTAVQEMPNIPWAEAVSPSPDGRRFAWVQGFGRSGSSSINIYDVGTGTSTPLGIEADLVAWSPVAERLAYLDRLTSLGIVSADGSGNRPMGISVFAGGMGAVDWSPDGEWIVHSRGDMMLLLQVSTGLNIPVPNSAGVSPAWK